MRKPRRSKLDPFADEIMVWFEQDKLPMKDAILRLKERGCDVSEDALAIWWKKRRHELLEEQLLNQIESAGDECARLENAFREHPAPAIDTLLKVYRVLVLKLNNQANASPALLQLAANLLKPLLEWSWLDLKKEENADAKLERRNELELKKAAEQRDASRDGLKPETLAQIERELKLL
jgi:hypothetical protein